MPITISGVYPVTTAQRGERFLQPQEQHIPYHKGSGTPANPQPLVERVTEGDLLSRRSTVDDADTAHFKTTGASRGSAGFAQRAIAEYQSLAIMRKGWSAPPHRVDEYA